MLITTSYALDYISDCYLGPLLSTLFNFNTSMDKKSYDW